tara:strand:+ start:340 stop:570 length:231 start_codon:yes stop_codon:yes gene_type:complete
MIISRGNKPLGPIQIDLTGPDGNAFALMKHAQVIGRKLGYSEKKIGAIIKVMKMSNYEGLIHTFDTHFGEYVILWR